MIGTIILLLTVFLFSLTHQQSVDWTVPVTATSKEAVPTIKTTGSSCTGTLSWNSTASAFSGQLTCVLSTPITAAHIHTVTPQYSYLAGNSGGVSFTLLASEQTSMNVNWTVAVNLNNLAKEYGEVCKDLTYINVHTKNESTGEVRFNLIGMAAVCATGKNSATLDQTQVTEWGTATLPGDSKPFTFKTQVGSGGNTCTGWITYVPKQITFAGACTFAGNTTANIKKIYITNSGKTANTTLFAEVAGTQPAFSSNYPFSFTTDFSDTNRDAMCAATSAANQYLIIVETDSTSISGNVVIAPKCPTVIPPIIPAPTPQPTPAQPAAGFMVSVSVLLNLFLCLMMWWM